MASDGVSLIETDNRTVDSAEQDQTERTCSLILLYTLAKWIQDKGQIKSVFNLALNSLHFGALRAFQYKSSKYGKCKENPSCDREKKRLFVVYFNNLNPYRANSKGFLAQSIHNRRQNELTNAKYIILFASV